jgi:hypothetical protein
MKRSPFPAETITASAFIVQMRAQKKRLRLRKN